MPATMDFDRLAHAWIAAWNSRDLERILVHYAEEVELISPFVVQLTGRTDGTVRGKTELRDYFGRGLAAYPALHFEFVRVYSGTNHCILEYRSVDDLRVAEMMEFDESGKVRRTVAHYFG
ncbi:MAG TPA: nuclear transport factor 2 family protein, partial [Desulfuromonadaceae bacterium]|nr:nuclear transport factor 2 family protein [Desulfuromonadaceae bacterium]